MEWTPLDIPAPAERDAVVLAPCHAGYAVRQSKRREGNKTVVYIEYTKER